MPKSELDSWGLHNFENDPKAQRMIKKEARRREIYKMKKEGTYTPKARKPKKRSEHFVMGSEEHTNPLRLQGIPNA